MSGMKIFTKRYFDLAVLAGLIAFSTFFFEKFLWAHWTLYALFFSTLYFFCAFTFLPWKTSLQKAISIGIFLGMSAALLDFLAGLPVK